MKAASKWLAELPSPDAEAGSQASLDFWKQEKKGVENREIVRIIAETRESCCQKAEQYDAKKRHEKIVEAK